MKIFFEKYLKFFVLIIALVFIFVGLNRHENQIVWKKSTKICLECIGIG